MKNLFYLPVNSIPTFLVIILLFTTNCKKSTDTQINDLSVEYINNPLGVDTPLPRFSWKISSEQRDVHQRAFQIIVGEDPENIDKGTGNTWDSGKIISDNTVNIEYKGITLKSNRKYFWRTRVWLDNNISVWSEPSYFHTGILDNSEWEAGWITPSEEIVHASPLLRKEFNIDKNVEQAYAFVSASGFYEFFLNGEKVGDHVLDPGITDYRKTVLYSTYDVTELLKKGVNAAGAILANGAYNLRKVEGRYSWGGGESILGNPAFLIQLMITYTDGSKSVVTTDETWKYTEGPITFNNLYGGEDYDARKESKGWSEKGFNDKDWKSVVINEIPGGKLKSQLMPAIKVTETINPVKSTNPSPGVYLFDLGQNIAGWWRITVSGSPGQTIRIRGSETLNDSLFPKPLEEGDELSTKFRYHSQTWTDYTLKGNEKEIYEPRFFYTGFRYMEVATDDKKNLEELNIEGRVVRSALENNGTFESSDSMINRIHRAGLWAQMGNTHGYPTDCPHREKGAYNGDGQVIAETSMHDFHMAAFYTKWINDMRDAQEEDGRIPNTSPTLVGGKGGGVGWGSAYILIPWWMYNYYDDTRILSDHYSTMKDYLMYLKNLGENDEVPDEKYIINDFATYWYSLGEWCAPGQSDCPVHPVVNTFYYYYNSLLISKIANVLGYQKDAESFLALSDTIQKEFNNKFFDPETCLYGTEETFQTYQLLALVGDIVPKEYREKVFATITDDIEKRDDHLNTGIIGTKYLWPVLVENGYGDLAFRVATRTSYPGYVYWINNNSTTLLEKWSGEHSHNHQMFGSVVEYFYKYLAGIRSPMEGMTSKGYRYIHIEPDVPSGLESVTSSLETVSGTVISEWRKSDNSFVHNISVPANSNATVVLPVSDIKDLIVSEGNSKIWDDGKYIEGTPGIYEVNKKRDKLEIKIGSGKYNFIVGL